MSKCNSQKHPKPAQRLLAKDLKAGDFIKAYFVYVYTKTSTGSQDYTHSHRTIKAIFLGNQRISTKYIEQNMCCFYTFDHIGFNLFWSQRRYIKNLQRIIGKST